MRTGTAAVLGAAVWIGLTGEPGVGAALIGAAAGLLTRWALGRWIAPPAGRGGRWAWSALPWVALRFASEVLVASLQQLRLVLAPRLRLRPCWIHFESRLTSPELRLVLAWMITLTPGTMTVDVEGSRLWLHALDGAPGEEAERRIRRRLEEPLLALERRRG